MTAPTLLRTAATTPRQPARDRTRLAKNRVQFDLPPGAMQRVSALRLETEASSGQVVKHALRPCDALIEAPDRPRQFLVCDAADVVSPFRLFL